MTKTLSKLEIEGNFLNLIKSIYKNPTANIFNHERLNAFFLRLGKRQRCSRIPLLLNILEVLATAVKQEKKIGNEEIKLPSFKDNMIVYVKKIPRNLQVTSRTNEFSKVVGYKVNIYKNISI